METLDATCNAPSPSQESYSPSRRNPSSHKTRGGSGAAAHRTHQGIVPVVRSYDYRRLRVRPAAIAAMPVKAAATAPAADVGSAVLARELLELPEVPELLLLEVVGVVAPRTTTVVGDLVPTGIENLCRSIADSAVAVLPSEYKNWVCAWYGMEAVFLASLRYCARFALSRSLAEKEICTS